MKINNTSTLASHKHYTFDEEINEILRSQPQLLKTAHAEAIDQDKAFSFSVKNIFGIAVSSIALGALLAFLACSILNMGFFCTNPPDISGLEYGEWSAWDTCTGKCGIGNQTRRRTRPSGEPREMVEVQKCELRDAECTKFFRLTEWSAWSTCSLTCGPGVTERVKNCKNIETGHAVADHWCSMNVTMEKKACALFDSCSDVYKWTDWSDWSPCSLTCEKGTQYMERECRNIHSNMTVSPDKCTSGDYIRYKHCQSPVLCRAYWADWESWSPCYPYDKDSIRERKCKMDGQIMRMTSVCGDNGYDYQRCTEFLHF